MQLEFYFLAILCCFFFSFFFVSCNSRAILHDFVHNLSKLRVRFNEATTVMLIYHNYRQVQDPNLPLFKKPTVKLHEKYFLTEKNELSSNFLNLKIKICLQRIMKMT